MQNTKHKRSCAEGEEKPRQGLCAALKVAKFPIPFLAGSILPVTDNLATDADQLLITALILCNGSELTALQSTNYHQRFPGDVKNPPRGAGGPGHSPKLLYVLNP